MTKTLTYIVGAAIVAVLAADAVLLARGTASTATVIELAVGGAVILALAVAFFIRAVSGWSASRSRKTSLSDVLDAVESAREDVSGDIERLQSTTDIVEERTANIASDLDRLTGVVEDRIGLLPDGFFATVNTVGDDGKLQKLYDLPVKETREEAVQSARDSLEARENEGNPVHNPRITVTETVMP